MSGKRARKERQRRQRREDASRSQQGPRNSCRGGGAKGPGCTACCTLLGIPTLDKPPVVPCPKLEPDPEHEGGQRCSVHGTSEQPRECREFKCGWLKDPGRVYTPIDRPDILGVMFTTTTLNHYPEEPSMVVREVREGALSSDRAKAMLGTISRHVITVLVAGRERLVIGPPHKVSIWQSRLGGLRALLGRGAGEPEEQG